jgi:hypothetical protein
VAKKQLETARSWERARKKENNEIEISGTTATTKKRHIKAHMWARCKRHVRLPITQLSVMPVAASLTIV